VTRGARLFANLGAEEGDGWTRMAAHPRVRTVARLWAALFASDARLVGPHAPSAPRLAAELACTAAEPALEACAIDGSLVAWLATPEALSLARAEALTFAGADPAIVRRVHDKVFAWRAAEASGLVPDPLAGSAFALTADELVDADTARGRIESAVTAWPEALRARFTLKPRIGTSGRGRCPGRDGRVDAARFATSLARLRAAGGVLVEPWLERTLDLSAQLHVAGEDDVRVLGTLRQVLTAQGGPVGHAGRSAPDGSVDSDTRFDAELRAAARTLALAAAREGFRGVCGVDAFVFRTSDGSERLRPIVELNARFTAGSVALGQLARARRAGLGTREGAFYFGFAPSGAWSEKTRDDVRIVAPLADDPSARLCLADDARALDDALGA
jgi:hypothetical protein